MPAWQDALYNPRMDLTQALQALRIDARFAEHITAWVRSPARAARLAPWPAGIDPRIVEAVHRQGIDALYCHQADAIAASLRGEDVIVVAGPAAGKTMCYNLPVMDLLLHSSRARALYLFPTKALAQDQLAAWEKLADGVLDPGTAATYDGDTPTGSRSRARREARVLITNPDMLHLGILPHHTGWHELFSDLKYVVLDEMHAYRGLLGGHVANVLRRMRRVCELYGSRPQFVLCSATIANPTEFASRLIGGPVTLVDNDGSPRGESHFVFYNPPLVDPASGLRRGLVVESAALASFFLQKELSTIVFHPGRRGTELLLKYLRSTLREHGESPNLVRGYRGGYLPRERREIERGLRYGTLRGVVSTNALELGVDIGELSVCILSGYPGTVASTRQQSGRAGRRQGTSVTVLVGGSSPLDQYLLAHPQHLLERTPEPALIAPDNPYLLRSHVKCAAFELPFEADEQYPPGTAAEPLLADIAANEGVLHQSGRKWFWMSSGYPASEVSLRTASAKRVAIVSHDGVTVGLVDAPGATQLVHEGAVYIHEGLTYLVEKLDLEAGVATVRATDMAYFTQPSTNTKVDVLQVHDSRLGTGATRGWGTVRVRTKTTSYSRLAWFSHEKLETVPLDLPESELLTTAYWLHLGAEVVKTLVEQGDWTVAALRSYGPNWPEQRRRARERDHYRCRQCGRPEVPGRQLDVHHLQPFRTFDYRPGENDNYMKANSLDNLVSLCSDCHKQLETARDMQGTLEGLANLLHGLAPLFLMCDPRDLGMAVDLDMGFSRAPTVVIYDLAPGGAGSGEELYARHDAILSACLDRVRECPCVEGCPSCVGAPAQEGLGAKSRVVQLLLRMVT